MRFSLTIEVRVMIYVYMTKPVQILITEGTNQKLYTLSSGGTLEIRRREPGEPEDSSVLKGSQLVHRSSSPYISQLHAIIHHGEDGRVTIKDPEGSKNGTYMMLPAGQESELDTRSHAMLAQEVITIRLQASPWESLPDPNRFLRSADFVRYLDSTLDGLAREVVCCPIDSPAASRPDGVATRLPLISTGECIIIRWSHTLSRAAERWLKNCVSLYNAAATTEPYFPKNVAWKFTAASSERLNVLRLACRVAPTASTVLITGQTGVGKEVLAHDIHSHSARAKGPFIAVNCAALAKDLVEAELFGALKESYTNCTKDRIGLFERAENGTLFLDEVGELPMEVQSKLLRALDTRRFRRVGESVEERHVATRIIAATNRNLEEMVLEGKFRSDLLFRLNAVQLAIPVLAPGDVRALVPLLTRQLTKDEYPEIPLSESETLADLASQMTWAGNARDLNNAIIRYALFRDPLRTVVENWKAILSMSQGFKPIPPGSSPKGGAASVTIEITADRMELHKLIDRLVFLHAARQRLFPKQRGTISKLADQLDMTSAGISARLMALFGKTEPEFEEVEDLIEQTQIQLGPHLPFLRALLEM